jgi:metal-responsive CopG/Arc/MetJ family transcriptional regulator
MDEELLAKLDADEEVQREGRSTVLRRAVEEYLRNNGGEKTSPCSMPERTAQVI